MRAFHEDAIPGKYQAKRKKMSCDYAAEYDRLLYQPTLGQSVVSLFVLT